FYTQAVTAEQTPPPISVIKAKGEHPRKTGDKGIPPGVVGLQKHFGVAVGEKPVSQGRQVPLQLAVIVDFPAIHSGKAQLLIRHRLASLVRQIDDMETALGGCAGLDQPTLFIDRKSVV